MQSAFAKQAGIILTIVGLAVLYLGLTNQHQRSTGLQVFVSSPNQQTAISGSSQSSSQNIGTGNSESLTVKSGMCKCPSAFNPPPGATIEDACTTSADESACKEATCNWQEAITTEDGKIIGIGQSFDCAWEPQEECACPFIDPRTWYKNHKPDSPDQKWVFKCDKEQAKSCREESKCIAHLIDPEHVVGDVKTIDTTVKCQKKVT